jgi:hypothetical protein
LSLLGWFEDLEGAHECFIDAHHCSSIIEFAAVVRCGKEGDELSAGKEFVSVFDDLMRAANEVQVVLVQKLRDNVLPERERDTPIVFAPSVNLLIGIGPKEITQETSIGDIGRAHNALHLIQTGKFWTETSVHAKDLFIDNCSTREAVEAVGKSLPELDTEASFTLVVKAVNPIDRGTLVVSTQDEEIFGVLDLVRQQQTDRLETLLATVHVVAQKDVIGLGWEATVFKETQQIIVLTVDITTDLDRSFQLEKHGLTDQKITTPETEHLDLGFRQVHLFSGPCSANTIVGRYLNDRIKREEEKKRLVSDSYPPITRLRGAKVLKGLACSQEKQKTPALHQRKDTSIPSNSPLHYFTSTLHEVIRPKLTYLRSLSIITSTGSLIPPPFVSPTSSLMLISFSFLMNSKLNSY